MGDHPQNRRVSLVLALVISCLLLWPGGGGGLPPAAAMGAASDAGAADPATPASGGAPLAATAVGSYSVAPVRILGVPALSVASPVVGQGSGPEASERAAVIEGNLSLLYQPRELCQQGEAIAEALLEGLVLGGPQEQRLCSGDPWSVLGSPDDLRVEVAAHSDGSVELQAVLKDRPEPFSLLSVTQADAQLHGLSQGQLAQRWRQVLQRRLRHARRTEQPSQLGLRWRMILVAELVLLVTLAVSLGIWRRLRRRLRRQLQAAQDRKELQTLPAQVLQASTRLLFQAVLVQLVVMLAIAVAATPGRIPLALAVLLQPFGILFKLLAIGLLCMALRLLAGFGLRQWVSSLALPLAQRARREQRYHNLLQVSHRLIDLVGFVVVAALVLVDIPGVRELTVGTWLAGGALLGGLAIAFQGVLRDLVAGLVSLLDDHYAVGDVVEMKGITGEVVDVGVLVTELRTFDQRVVVVANSACDHLINHTKIRSGVEVVLPLSPQLADLEQALAVLESETAAFAADPSWCDLLLEPPQVRGLKEVTPQALELSVVLTTRTGQQWLARRALLRRLVVALQRAGVPLAGPGNGLEGMG